MITSSNSRILLLSFLVPNNSVVLQWPETVRSFIAIPEVAVHPTRQFREFERDILLFHKELLLLVPEAGFLSSLKLL
jgi:hypothetical protein